MQFDFCVLFKWYRFRINELVDKCHEYILYYVDVSNFMVYIELSINASLRELVNRGIDIEFTDLDKK